MCGLVTGYKPAILFLTCILALFQITDLQYDLLELRDAHAKLRTTNEKLRRDKEKTERERDEFRYLVRM